jgi:hypothetical protein
MPGAGERTAAAEKMEEVLSERLDAAVKVTHQTACVR